MASFQDQFQYADDTAIEGTGGWVTNSGDTSAITVQEEYASNSGAVNVRATQTATVPTTSDQKVEAWLTSAAQGAAAYIDIGIYGATSAIEGGVWARLHWDADSVRTLSIMYRVGDESSDSTAATLTMVAAGGVVQSGYYGRLLGDGSVNTMQHLRLIVVEDTAGLVVAAYVNHLDDDQPTLMARIPSVPTAVGLWFFEFVGTTADTLKVGSFEAEDYSLPDRREVALHPDWPNLAEVREQVERRVSRGVNHNLDQEYLDDEINNAWDELLQEFGDKANFLVVSETLSITFDNEGFSTLPRHIEMPISIELTSGRGEINWTWDHLDSTTGAVVIRQARTIDQISGNHRIIYRLRPARAFADEDQLAWPRKYLDLLVTATVLRVAEGDRNPQWEASQEKRYTRLLAKAHRDLNRAADHRKDVFQPRRARVTRAGRWWRYQPR